MAEHLLAEFREPSLIRRFMDAVEGGAVQAHEPGGNSLICQKHELLDELVGEIVHHLLDPVDGSILAEPDLRLRKIKIEGSCLEPGTANLLGEGVGLMQHRLRGVLRGALQGGEGLLIAEPSAGMDDSGVELCPQDLTCGGKDELHALCQPVHPGFQRAEFIAEGLGKHRDDAVHQIGGISTLGRLCIQCGAGLYIMGDIRNMNPEFPLVLIGPLEAEGVVKILRIKRVDGDHIVGTAVHSAQDVLGLYLGPDLASFAQHNLGEVQGEIVVADDGEHVHPLGSGRSEHFNDFPLGTGIPMGPLLKFHHHLVASAGGATHIGGGRNQNVLRDARVVRNHKKDLTSLLQGADELDAGFFENADHPTRPLAGVSATGPGTHIQPHQDLVPVHGCSCGILGDTDGGEARIIRLHETDTLPVHADASRNQVGLHGQGVAGPLFDPGDATRTFQPAQHLG